MDLDPVPSLRTRPGLHADPALTCRAQNYRPLRGLLRSATRLQLTRSLRNAVGQCDVAAEVVVEKFVAVAVFAGDRKDQL
jgi:hypothetical protein